LLAEQLKDLSLLELDFSLEVTGFEMAEIDLRIEGPNSEPEGDDPADALPEAQSRTAVTRRGDHWLLGSNEVLCVSALEDNSYATLMQNEKAGMAFIDPPYNVAIEGNVSGLGAIRHPNFAMACGEMSVAQFTTFLARIFSLLGRSSLDGALHYICMDWRHLSEVLSAGQVYTELKNLCVWVKNHTGMGAFYRSRHELIRVYKHGRASHRNNILFGKFGRDRTNVWTYPSPRTPSEEGNLLALHPTVKPVQLVADAILDCTAHGEIVLDAFLGSGTTLMLRSVWAGAAMGLNSTSSMSTPSFVAGRRLLAMTPAMLRLADRSRKSKLRWRKRNAGQERRRLRSRVRQTTA
jgi:DNA methylase